MKLGMIRNACDDAAFQYIKEKNQNLKRLGQIAFEARHSHDEWMQIFRKNYI